MRRIGCAALMLGVAVTACAVNGTDGAADRSPEAPTSTIDPAASGVGIVAEGCSLVAQLGSGAVVGEPGRIVTVAHTISGASNITVIDANGAEHAARVSGFDKDADLAVLDVPGLDVAALQLASSVTIGQASLITWDSDDGVTAAQVQVTRRLAITIEDIYVEDTVRRSGLEIAGDVEVGDSGGAIVDANGDVVGIVYANSRQRDEVGFATDVVEVTRLLADTGPGTVDNGRCI